MTAGALTKNSGYAPLRLTAGPNAALRSAKVRARPVLVFAAYSLLRVRVLWQKRQRKKLGLCLTCGYDLRGTTEADRCPECGTAKP